MTSFLSQSSRITRLLLLSGAALVVYNYVCHTAGINFFWESEVISWFVLLLGAISFLVNQINGSSRQTGAIAIYKLATYGLVFLLVVKTILFVSFAFSDAFQSASYFLKTNKTIASKIGPVSGVILLSEGEINTSSNSNGEKGEGVLNIVAKGQSKYQQFTVHLLKKYEMETWQVVDATPSK